MDHTVYLALGSNLGDRHHNLKNALASLPPSVNPLVCSPVYETPPWGYIDQPAFLNQIVQAETNLIPEDLLAYLKRLERGIGRQARFRYGPREIDLDILLYDDLVIKSESLTIPHPGIQERAFVLVPLADLVPELHHPVIGLTVSEMLTRVDRTGVRWYSHSDCGKIRDE